MVAKNTHLDSLCLVTESGPSLIEVMTQQLAQIVEVVAVTPDTGYSPRTYSSKRSPSEVGHTTVEIPLQNVMAATTEATWVCLQTSFMRTSHLTGDDLNSVITTFDRESA